MKLFVKKFGKTLTEIQLEEGKEYFLGRHKDCDIVLEDAKGISRKHLKLYQSPESGVWTLELISDLGGLRWNGEELEGVELEESATLGLNNYVLEFLKEEEKNISEALAEKTKGDTLPVLEQKEQEPNLDGKTKILNPSELTYSLHIYIDGEISDHISLNEEKSWLIGRAADCDISIDYNVLTRKHLKIIRDKKDFYVEDLGSANKTVLNGKTLPSNKATLLKANDQISVSELKMVFEVRNRNFNEMISKLPVLSSPDLSEEESLPEIPFPKVILEEISEEEQEGGNVKRSSFLNRKKYLLLVVGLVVLGGGLYFQNEADKEKKKQLREKQRKRVEEKQKLEAFLKEAIKSKDQYKYRICKEQIEELHNLAPTGFSDGVSISHQILRDCEQGLLYQQKEEEIQAREEKAKQTQEKIKKIAEKCQKEYKDKKIETEEQLNRCAEELMAGLDPMNAEISAIRREIIEKQNLQAMEEQKRVDYRQFLQRKRALYKRAEKKAQQGKVLEAVAAYNVFLKSARGLAALKSLSQKAREERDTIQTNYDEELNQLHKSCEDLIQNNKMKEAYKDCQKVLLFKDDDTKAKEYMKMAAKSLRKKFKPLYEQSMMDESFSRVEEAKKIWKEILEQDIEGGYYYQKALSQIKKYK